MFCAFHQHAGKVEHENKVFDDALSPISNQMRFMSKEIVYSACVAAAKVKD